MKSENCKNCPLIEENKYLHKQIEELKKYHENDVKPKKDSSNSSLPPSVDKTKKYPPRKKSGKKAGGQKGHKGNTRMMVENPDKIVELYPDNCTHCGNDEFVKKENILERRQVTDIPEVKPYTIEYQQKAGICTKCGNRNKGIFPVNAPISFGSIITSIIGYLSVQHHVSNERISNIFSDLLGLSISKGSVDNKIKDLSASLTPTYYNIHEQLKKSDWIGSDETGSRIEGKNAYQWVFQNNLLSFFTSSYSRAFQVIEENIGNNFNGSWVSDRYGAQLKIEANHQLCLAHLIRECKYIEEAENSKWAKSLRALLINLIKFRKSKGDNFNPFEAETYRNIGKLKQALYRIFSKSPPKKFEKKLFKGLIGRQNQLIHFLDNPNVPFDNNGSERALRNRVIKRKVSGGFRSYNGAICHDIIASVIETAKKQGKNIFQILFTSLDKSQFLLTT